MSPRSPLTVWPLHGIPEITAGTDLVDEMGQQRIETDHLDMGVVGNRVAGQLHAQLQRQGRALGRALGDTEDQPIEQSGGAIHQVDVAVGDRIEGAGIDGDSVAGRGHSVEGSSGLAPACGGSLASVSVATAAVAGTRRYSA